MSCPRTPFSRLPYNFLHHYFDGKLPERLPRWPFYLLLVAAMLGVSFYSSAQAPISVTNINDSGEGSLRQAIIDSNNTAGTQTISFNIPGSGVRTITPLSPLPSIDAPVVIDGTTQPGFAGTPLIELNGASAGASATGIFILGGNSTIRGLAINRFAFSGIFMGTGGGNIIEGNFVGTDPTGTIARGNSGVAVFASNSANNRIGGTTPAQRNLISGNNFNPLGLSQSGSTGNVVQGNYIGTNVTGTVALANALPVAVDRGASNNTIGGTAPGAGNLISGNLDTGVAIFLSATNNRVQGNLIGTNAAGTVALPNGGPGVTITDASTNNLIGGTIAGARNIISGNNGTGIRIGGDATNATTTGNQVQGNFIGTDVTGTQALGNVTGGLDIFAANSTIGGTTTSARNVISANGGSGGIAIFGSAATGNSVQGNFIGTQANGTSPLGTQNIGVLIANNPQNNNTPNNNTIGGTAGGAGNVIAFNLTGVRVTSGAGNAILSNSIHSNGTTNLHLGIDLGANGVNANDAGDGDTGANTLQNFPVLTAATVSGGTTTITGTLNSTASTAFTIQFFSNPTCDASGNGEGQTFLGSTSVTTDGAGNAAINTTLGGAVTVGQVVTATATNPNGNTSEFSVCVPVMPPPTFTISGRVADGANNPLSGVTVTLSGAQTGTTTTDASGNYAFANLAAGGNYVVTPTQANFTFNPANASFSNLQTNQTANFTGTSAQVCVAPPANMVAWYPGDGNANDIQGGNNGTLQGNTTFAPGKVGQTFRLDGNGDRVLISNQASLQLQNFTIDGWIRRASSTVVTNDGRPGVEGGAFFAYGSGGYGFLIDQATNRIGLTRVEVSNVFSTSTITDTNFHHVAVTKSGNQVTFYIDGVADAPVTYDPGFTFTTDAAIGARGDSDLQNAFFGDVDELEIFNRALSQTEIQSIVNAGSAGKCKTPQQTFTISGRIADGANNPLAGVTVTLSGTQTATTTTDASGNYAFANLAASGNYTVTPSRAGFTFTPPSQTFNNLQANQTANFTGTAQGSGITNNYIINQSTGAQLVPGVTDIGNHCDDCTTPVTLPFAYTLYDRTFTTANISSNGVILFGGNSIRFSNDCLPLNDADFDYSILGYWDDIRTDAANIPGLGPSGIFTSVTGTAPNRIFNVEWRSTFFNNNAQAINFEIRLYEGQSRFDVVYAQIDQFGSSSTVGVQRTATSGFTEYECNTGGLTPGLQLTFTGSDQLFISGLVTTANGAGISGVTVSLSGSASASVTTDASGFYSFGNLVAGGNYTITPARAGFTFTPPSQTFQNFSGSRTANFIGAQSIGTFTISGRVSDTGGNSLGGVSVTLVNEDANQVLTTTTDTGGNYSFTVPAGSDYTVTPISNGFTFAPSFRTFLNLSGNQVGNFVGTGAITITGQITNLAPGQIVTVVLSGTRSGVTTTDANGNYSFAGLPVGGDYTVTPLSSAQLFNPPSVIVTDLNNNMTTNFTAAANPNPSPTPPIVEDFAGATRDPLVFSEGTLTQPPGSTDPLVTVVQQNGQLVITPRSGVTDASFNGYVTTKAVDFTNATASVQVIQTADNGAQTIFAVGSSSENFFRFVVQEADPDPAIPSAASGGAPKIRPAQTGLKQLIFQVRQAGVFNALPIPYDPVEHRFWRFRHDAVNSPATMNFETSPTGLEGTYTVRFVRVLGGPIGSLATELAAGTAGAVSNPGQAIFDTLDVQPRQAATIIGRFSFASSTLSVDEGAGSVTIVVRRAGGVSSEALIELAGEPFDNQPCATVDGKARPRCDYATTFTRLRFASGEAQKTITLFITDDSYQEGVESFRLALGNQTEGFAVDDPLASVRIIDNDQITGPNPIYTAPFLVRQQYRDFLYREGEAGGFNAWVNVLLNCAFEGDFGPGKSGSDPTCDRIHVSSSFYRSPEFQERGFFLYRFYEAALGRRPFYTEFLADIDRLSAAQSPAQQEANKQAFIREFMNRAGTTGNQSFRDLYGDFNTAAAVDALLARAGVTLPNRDQLVADLVAGRRTPEQTLRLIIESRAISDRFFNRAFVTMQYFGYLQRDPDEAGFNNWVRVLETTGDFRAMIFGFLYSTEYQNRFGPAR